ncbi:hypothetical protein HDU84_003447 [Entophlyctis sp. JEL0112]|nr:hypothetical protein HDU84_003447 [Entophlyctis sp. JEL0112]
MSVNELYEVVAHPRNRQLATFAEFYPFYLGKFRVSWLHTVVADGHGVGEHRNRTSRRLHVIGTTGALGLFATALATLQPKLVAVGFVFGYSLAWVIDSSVVLKLCSLCLRSHKVGHFCFEGNRPATFKYPVWSFVGDLRMWFEVVTLKRAF